MIKTLLEKMCFFRSCDGFWVLELARLRVRSADVQTGMDGFFLVACRP